MKIMMCILFSLLSSSVIYAQSSVPITIENAAEVTIVKTIELPLPLNSVNNFQSRVFFTPDGNSLLYIKSPQLILIDVATGEVTHSIEQMLTGYPLSIKVSINKDYIAIVTNDELCVWALSTNTITICNPIQLKQTYEKQAILSVAFNTTGDNLYVLTQLLSIYNPNAFTGKVIHTFDLLLGREIDRKVAPSCSSDQPSSTQQTITGTNAICFSVYSLDFFDIDTLEKNATLTFEAYIYQVEFSGDGRKVFVRLGCCFESSDPIKNQIAILDATTGEQLQRYDIIEEPLSVPVYNDEVSRLGDDYSVTATMNALTREILFTPKGELVFNEDMTMMVSASDKIYLYALAQCVASADRDVNTRIEPDTESQVGIIIREGENYAVFESTTLKGKTWWQTGDGYWVREDVITLTCQS